MTENDKYFRFSIRFNLEKEDHIKALERLEKVRKGEKSEFCIHCILERANENDELKELIKKTIEECLKGISAPKEEVDVMDSVIDFMNGL